MNKQQKIRNIQMDPTLPDTLKPILIAAINKEEQEKNKGFKSSYIGKDKEKQADKLGLGKREDDEYIEEGGLVKKKIKYPKKVKGKYYTSYSSDKQILEGKELPPIRNPIPITPQAKAQYAAETRIEGLISDFETTNQPEAENFAQERYNELINSKAQELGMRYDPKREAYIYTNEYQQKEFESYQPIAEETASQEGNEYYLERWQEGDYEDRIENIYEEEYEEQNFVAIEKNGQVYFVPKKQIEKQKEYESKRELIRSQITGTLIEKLAQGAKFITGAFLSPTDLGQYRVIGEALFGGEDKSERILDILTEQQMILDKAAQTGGIPKVFAKSYEPGGFGFLGTASALFVGGTQAIGAAGASATASGATKTGAVLSTFAKDSPWAIGYLFSGLTGAEVGMEAAKQKTGDVLKDFFSEDVGKLLTKHGTELGFALGFGYSATRQPINVKPKYEVTYNKQTGELGINRYYEVLGKKLPISRTRYGQILEDSPLYEVFKNFDISSEPTSPFKSGVTKPTPSNVLKVDYIDPDVGYALVTKYGIKQATPTVSDLYKTGILEPGIYTGKQLSTKVWPKPIVKTKPGELDLFDPILTNQKPLVESDIFKAKGTEWQPKTGISLEDYEKGLFEKNQKEFIKKQEQEYDTKMQESLNAIERKLRTRTKTKGLKPIVTKFDLTDDGIVNIKKYGRNFMETGKVKSIEGILEPGIYTGKQLSTKVWPKPIVKTKPGKVSIWEPTIKFDEILETGQSVLAPYKLRPRIKVKKIFTLKDIIKTEKEIMGEGQSQRGGQRTIQIQKQKTMQKLEPKLFKEQDSLLLTKSKQELIFEKKLKTDLFTNTKLKPLTKKNTESISILKPIQKQEQKLNSILLFNPKQESIQEQKFKLIQESTIGEISISGIKTKPLEKTIFDTEFDRIQNKIQKREQIFDFEKKLELETEITKKKIKRGKLEQEEERINNIFFGMDAYHVQIRERQFKDGKRISKGKFETITKKPLSRDDALSLASHIVDNTAKASFKLIKAEGKPVKLKKNVQKWSDVFFEYNDKGNDYYTERAEHRIDSPGEIEEITMRGIRARSNKVLPSINKSFEKRIDRIMRRVM